MNPQTEQLRAFISAQQLNIATALAPYDNEYATRLWLDTLRGIEEIINLVNVDWDDDVFAEQLFEFPVYLYERHIDELHAIRHQLSVKFSENFANRFCKLILQGAAISEAFAAHGRHDVSNAFQSVKAMIGYLQSRRRHFVALLHFLAFACRGQKPVSQHDTLNIFLPLIELHAVPMVGAQQRLAVMLAQERLGITVDGNAELAMLDRLFLEPERNPIVGMPLTEMLRFEVLQRLEPLQSDRLFSAAELRNEILCIEMAYEEFGLGKTDFAVAAALVCRLSVEHIERDFWVVLSPVELNELMNSVGASAELRAALVCHTDDYAQCLSSYAPLVLLNNRYLSTVTLLSRFMYFWRAKVLEGNKRYQIRSGFIFEDAVKNELAQQGFAIQDIVRINQQEFDVVTVRRGIIWNVQCKNNFIDLERVDSDAEVFARYNHKLVRAYERALTKERSREHLLKQKLSIETVQHMLVSKFPVVTDNPRIVVFSRIADFAQKADNILNKG